MSLASGLDSQFGFKAESAYGTVATVDRFLEFLDADFNVVTKSYLPTLLGRARTMRSHNKVTYQGRPTANINFVVQDRSFGRLFQHCLGAVATAGAGPTYTHTVTKGTVGQKGLFATVQLGVPSNAGTVHPFNFLGGKVFSWGLACAVGEPLKLSTSWSFKAFQTSTALAAASYAAAPANMIFSHGAATINGAAVNIKSFALNVDNGLGLDRDFVGAIYLEPLPVAELAITGQFEFELENLTRLGEITAGTLIQDTVLTFTTGSHSLATTIPEMIYTDGPGKIDAGVIMQSLPWKALDDGTLELMTMVYTSPDAAA